MGKTCSLVARKAEYAILACLNLRRKTPKCARDTKEGQSSDCLSTRTAEIQPHEWVHDCAHEGAHENVAICGLEQLDAARNKSNIEKFARGVCMSSPPLLQQYPRVTSIGSVTAVIDLLVGMFRGAVFHQGGVPKAAH